MPSISTYERWSDLQWYFSNGNDYENGNNLTVVNGNENDVDFQNENNIKIKTMSYKTYKNENVKKRKKITWMITVTKTSSSCLSNRIVPCIYLWSHVRLHAESDLKRQMNTDRPIIRIPIRSGTTPTDTLDYWRQQKHYMFAQDLLSVRRLRHTWKESFPSVGCWHQGTAIIWTRH